MQIIARRNYLTQRSVSYQSSFDSRPSTAKISFQSSRKTFKTGGKSNPNLDQKKSSSLSPAEPRVKLSLRPSSANVPKKKDINFVQQNIKKTGIIRQRCGVTPRIDPGVESRLRYNRNYQAPRKKKTIVIKVIFGSPTIFLRRVNFYCRNPRSPIIFLIRNRIMRLTLRVTNTVTR